MTKKEVVGFGHARQGRLETGSKRVRVVLVSERRIVQHIQRRYTGVGIDVRLRRVQLRRWQGRTYKEQLERGVVPEMGSRRFTQGMNLEKDYRSPCTLPSSRRASGELTLLDATATNEATTAADPTTARPKRRQLWWWWGVVSRFSLPLFHDEYCALHDAVIISSKLY